MKEVELSILSKEDPFELIGKKWMLVTAGNAESHNTMTASWGGIGWLWNRPVAFVFIRPERYTHLFIEQNERLTLSFYTEDYRKALQICGTKSGRDTQKEQMARLTPIQTPSGSTTFAQACLTLDCRKLFRTAMTEASFLDKSLLERWYNNQPGDGLHDIYIVEIEHLYAED